MKSHLPLIYQRALLYLLLHAETGLYLYNFSSSLSVTSLWLKCSKEPLSQILSFRCHRCTHAHHSECVGLQKRNHSCSSLLHEESVCDLVQQALIKLSTLCVRMSVLKRIEHKHRHMEHLSLFTVPGHIHCDEMLYGINDTFYN